MAQVTVYSKNNCMQCKMTKKFLSKHNIEFEERNINEQPQYIDDLKASGFMRVPVIEADGMDAFSGFNPSKLNQLVNQQPAIS